MLMFKTLYAKLVGAQTLAFFALGIAFVAVTERMPEGPRLVELIVDLAVGALLFSLVGAVLIFFFLTRPEPRRAASASPQALTRQRASSCRPGRRA